MSCSNSDSWAKRRKKVRHFDEPGHAHFLTFSCYRRFWQAGPGQDRNIYDAGAALKIIEYIHNNRVRRGLVERADDWPWWSACDWAGEEDVCLKVDRTVPCLNEFTA